MSTAAKLLHLLMEKGTAEYIHHIDQAENGTWRAVDDKGHHIGWIDFNGDAQLKEKAWIEAVRKGEKRYVSRR